MTTPPFQPSLVDQPARRWRSIVGCCNQRSGNFATTLVDDVERLPRTGLDLPAA